MVSQSIETVKEKAKAQEWSPPNIISGIESIELYDRKFIQHCKTLKSELVPRLLKLNQGDASIATLHGGLLLLYLHDPVGTTGVVKCLRDGNDELQESALIKLSLLPKEKFNDEFPYWLRYDVPLQSESVFVELKKFLDRPEKDFGKIALRVAGNLNIPAVEPYMNQFLKHPSREIRIIAVNWYARREKDQGALETAADLLLDTSVKPKENYGVISSLEIYCRGSERSLALDSAANLATFVHAYVDEPGNDMANLIARGLKALQDSDYPDEYQAVNAVLDSTVHDWRRGVALQRLSELRGLEIIDLLQISLNDATLRQFAARGIANIAAGYDDQTLIDTLLAALQVEKRNSVSREVINALLVIGGNALSKLEDMIPQLSPDEAMRVYWLANNISLQEAANLLVDTGLIPKPDQTSMHQIEEEWQEQQDPMSVVLSLFTDINRLVWFDCENGRVPPDYRDLLDNLVTISSPVFKPEAISQTVDNVSGQSEIAFIYDKKPYSILVQNLGDWFDVQTFFRGLNSILAGTGKNEQFFLLYTGDQTCIVVFAQRHAFLQVTESLKLPLEENYQAAMKTGIAYEQYIREKIEKENRKSI